MGEILIIRHGETDWNRDEIFRGRLDIPLSEYGRQQAKLIAKSLSARSIEAIYTSPLSRAKETAAPLADTKNLPVVTEIRFMDMNFGEWEGKAREELERAQPELYQQWLRCPQSFCAPAGESLGQVMARVWPALEEISNRHAKGSVVVVSHRVVCKLLLSEALGAGLAAFWRIRVDTGAINALLKAERQWIVTSLNDLSHLAPLAQKDRIDF